MSFLKENNFSSSDVFDDELEREEYSNSHDSVYNVIKSYFEKTNKNGKQAMHDLGADIANAYAKYLSEEFIDEEAFKNDDVKLKYMNAVRDKVAEALKEKMTDFFEGAGQTADEIRLTLPIK
jgi:flagellar hook-basal body complex protein FliE